MANSANSLYFPGGTGLAGAAGALVPLGANLSFDANGKLAAATGGTSAAFNGDIGAATYTVNGGQSQTFSAGATRTYRLADYGTGRNRTGANGIDDLPGWNLMAARILADAANYQDNADSHGFHAIVELEPHRHDWSAGPQIIVPANSAGTGSSLPCALHVTVRYHGSSHFMRGSQGFLLQGYTCASQMRYEGTACFTALNPTGVTQYAVARSATAGVGATAFSAAGGGFGVCTFHCDEVIVFDGGSGTYSATNTSANPPQYAGQNSFQTGIDLGGCILARIKDPTVYGRGSTTAAGYGNLYPLSSAIIVRGFNIQIQIDNFIGQYKDAGVRIVGYIESLYLYHFGGSGFNRCVYTDITNTDWTSFYPGDNQPIFVMNVAGDVETDANIACFDLTRCNIVRILGGYYFQHTEQGGSYNGTLTGDVNNNGCLIFRACDNIYVGACDFSGPARDAQSANGDTDGSGNPILNTAKNGVRGILLTQATFSGLAGKTNGPANATYQCHLFDHDGSLSRGMGDNGATNLTPIYIDHTVNKVTTRNCRWFPPPYKDGFIVGSPVYDTNTDNNHRNYSGTTSGSIFKCITVNAAGTAVS